MPLSTPLRVSSLLAALSTLGAGAAAAQVIQPPDVIELKCPVQIFQPPTGTSARLDEDFADPDLFASPQNSQDYHWVHSGTHLQGKASTQKFAACAFYDAPFGDAVPDLSGFRTALVVNNPSPVSAANLTLRFRNPLGIVFATRFVTIGPEATYLGAADVFSPAFGGPGLGSIEVASDQPVVGATVHHLESGGIRIGTTSVIDPDVVPFTPRPGGNSMQQLQVSQNATTLFGGPYPLSNSASEDLMNGLLPFNCILNASPNPTTVTVATALANGGGTLSVVSAPLAAFGLFLDTALWQLAEPFYLAGPAPFDADAITSVAATAGGSLIGETIQADFFRNTVGPGNLALGGRFRMFSTMMPSGGACELINPELTYTAYAGATEPPPAVTNTPPVNTYMAIANFTANNIGPVTAQFFSRDGALLLTRTLASLPPGGVHRYTQNTGPWVPSGTFAGSVRIRSTRPGLVGWTAREIQQQNPPTSPNHFKKAYGEVLSGGNLKEPGHGINVFTGGANFLREVAPLNRAGDDFDFPFDWWPGYATADNTTAANIGNYFWRWFSLPGVNLGQAGFPGLWLNRTSFTHVDPTVFTSPAAELSGRFDRTQGANVEGIDVIGDPLQEWNIPGLFNPGGAGGTWSLPEAPPAGSVGVEPVDPSVPIGEG